MKFRYDVDTKSVLENLDKYPKAVIDAVNKEILITGEQARSTAIRRINQAPAGGRIYKRGKTTHKASAPGEYPKTDSGNLVKSIKVINDTIKNGIQGILFGTYEDYGIYLEYGTTKMSARPWAEPSVRYAARDQTKRIKEEIKRAIDAIK